MLGEEVCLFFDTHHRFLIPVTHVLQRWSTINESGIRFEPVAFFAPVVTLVDLEYGIEIVILSSRVIRVEYPGSILVEVGTETLENET